MGWKKPGLYVQNNETAARGFYAQPPVFCNAASVNPPDSGSKELKIRALSPTDRQAMFFVNLPRPGSARLGVYDLSGRLVHTYEGQLQAGLQTLSWNPNEEGAPAGTYFYRLDSNGMSANGRVVILH